MLGSQATVGFIGLYGHTSTSPAATLSGGLRTPLGTLPFARSDNINDAVWGFGDIYPLATLRWNHGVHNFMVCGFRRRAGRRVRFGSAREHRRGTRRHRCRPGGCFALGAMNKELSAHHSDSDAVHLSSIRSAPVHVVWNVG